MILKKLEIRSFGKFKEFELSPAEGLNLYCRENEFGKTTLIYFIYYMFYGYDAKLLKRYLPWSGEELAGSLEFSQGGKTWKIERRRPLRGMEKRKVFCLETGQELALAAKEQPGEQFLGLDGETFLRSFCITQGDLLFSHTKGLDVALKNMAATGEENVSSAQAEEYLNKIYTQYKHHGRNRGNLLDWEDALSRGQEQESALRAAVDARISERKELEALDQSLAQKEQELSALEQKVRAAEGSDALKLLRRLDALKALPRAEKPTIGKEDLAALEQAFEAQEQANRGYKEAQERAEQSHQALYDADGALRAYGFHAETERELAALKQKGSALPMLLIILGIGINGLGIALTQWWINIAACALMVAGILWMVAKGAKRKEICRRYAVSDGDELAQKWAEYQALSSQREALSNAFEAAREAERLAKTEAEKSDGALEELRLKYRILTAKEAQEQRIAWGVYEAAASGQSIELQEQAILGGRSRAALEQAAAGATEQEQSAEEARAELRRAELAREALRSARAEKDHRDLQNLWDSLEQVQAENEALKQKIAEGKATLASVEQALEWLQAANEEMNTYFAPKLCKAAGEYLSALTAGKYQSLLMDREYAIQLQTSEGTYPAEQFSEGTKDAIYFSFRLAAADMLGEEPLPMILDDPFTNLDDPRCAEAQTLLEQAAKGRQILYFSCRAGR